MRIMKLFDVIKIIFLFSFLCTFLNISPNNARSEIKNKFMTTKYNEVNVRNGPGLNHLKVYKIYRKGYPLKVTKKFENWKKVSDYKGELGWVSNSQLTEKKRVLL